MSRRCSPVWSPRANQRLQKVAGESRIVPAVSRHLLPVVRTDIGDLMETNPPLCPTCGQPASEALGGPEHDWECRNEACPEFGQPVQADEPFSESPGSAPDG